MDTKVVLCCHPMLPTSVMVTAWEILIRDKSSCIKAYRRDRNKTMEKNYNDKINASWPILMGKNAVLCCPPIALKYLIIITWEIILRGQTFCKKGYRKETNETKETNYTDERITWVSRADQNPALQIHPVAINHDRYYRCIMGTPDGNFHRGYHLQVLVTPEVTLFQSRNGTVVCKAVAGKPAAQISWIPEGDCVTEQEYWGNGTVTVKSTCHWEGHDVSTVTCCVSHLTGNKSLSIKLNSGLRISGSPALSLLIILYVKLSFCGDSGHHRSSEKKEISISAQEKEVMVLIKKICKHNM
ncbi:Cell surface glycoprotein CD200 receptor 2, partial [Plecturocebus cupreus]